MNLAINWASVGLRGLTRRSSKEQREAAEQKALIYTVACLREGIQPEPLERAAREALEVIVADGAIETPATDDDRDIYMRRNYDQYRGGSFSF